MPVIELTALFIWLQSFTPIFFPCTHRLKWELLFEIGELLLFLYPPSPCAWTNALADRSIPSNIPSPRAVSRQLQFLTRLPSQWHLPGSGAVGRCRWHLDSLWRKKLWLLAWTNPKSLLCKSESSRSRALAWFYIKIHPLEWRRWFLLSWGRCGVRVASPRSSGEPVV